MNTSPPRLLPFLGIALVATLLLSPPVAAQQPAPATPSAPDPAAMPMSPELMRRYGLLPSSEPDPIPSPTPAPTEDLRARLVAAQFTEEGDGDLEGALAEYRAILADFDRLRPVAAESLLRLAEVSRKLGRIENARVAYARILREFTDATEPAAIALQHLNALEAQAASNPGTAQPSAEFRTRYGPGGMDPILRARYGLAPVQPPAPRTTDPAVSGLAHEIEALRQESRTLATQLRQVQLELRAADSGLDQLPTRFVQDPQLLEAMANLERLRDQRAAAPLDAPGSSRAMDRLTARLEEYFKNIYLPRLLRTQELLSAELARLKSEIDWRELERHKLQSLEAPDATSP
ncbi:MAG: hypothetical protein KF833_11375 [Verrucomicrobiae bacterium]|nr:hypothetical protein [Verrucomicrobiae bacterium]